MCVRVRVCTGVYKYRYDLVIITLMVIVIILTTATTVETRESDLNGIFDRSRRAAA